MSTVVPNDIYWLIAENADDRTTLEMLKLNKRFDDTHFQKIINKRYPLLIRFKQENESWQDFYVRMIHFIALLQEKFQFPYIPHPKFNPEKFYKGSYIFLPSSS